MEEGERVDVSVVSIEGERESVPRETVHHCSVPARGLYILAVIAF